MRKQASPPCGGVDCLAAAVGKVPIGAGRLRATREEKSYGSLSGCINDLESLDLDIAQNALCHEAQHGPKALYTMVFGPQNGKSMSPKSLRARVGHGNLDPKRPEVSAQLETPQAWSCSGVYALIGAMYCEKKPKGPSTQIQGIYRKTSLRFLI